MIELYGLYKNGKLACISQDSDALFDKFLQIKPDGCSISVKKLNNSLTFLKEPRSNESLGLRSDGSPQLTRSTADAIGKALERCEDSMVDFNSDDEWKTRAKIDKINGSY